MAIRCERSCQRARNGRDAQADPLPRFPSGAVWNQDVSAPNADASAMSDQMIAWLQSHGGWGTGATTFQIDFSMAVLHADATTPTVAIIGYPYDDYYSPDCDDPGTVPFPLPIGGTIEGSGDYTCDERQSDDCHLLVVVAQRALRVVSQQRRLANGLESQCARALGSHARVSAGRARRSVHERRCGGVSDVARCCSMRTKSTTAIQAQRRHRPCDPLHPAQRPHEGR